MNKLLIVLLGIGICFAPACNNSGKNKVSSSKTDTIRSGMDSLEQAVEEGHNDGMSKMGKLKSMQLELERIVDSIKKLPAKAQLALAPYKEKVNKVIEDLKAARLGMDKWMDEYRIDSAVNDAGQRMKYLAEEKLKVSTIKENILNGIQNADSLIRAKF